MAEKNNKYILVNEENLTISVRSVDKLLTAGRGELALVYLYVLRTRGEMTAASAAAELSMSENEVVAAMNALERMGLVRGGERVARLQENKLPSYTNQDLAYELKQGEFEALVQQVQQILGTHLSSPDTEKLLGLRRALGFPPEVILMLVQYCVEENERRYGSSRRPTMRFVEKVAFRWEEEGIDTAQKAEEYLQRLEKRRTLQQQMKKVLQIYDRELTPTEQKYVGAWIEKGFTPELVAEAYDMTMIRTGRRAWAYMNSVLQTWYEKGVTTPEQLDKAKTGASDCVGNGGKKPNGTVPGKEVDSMLRLLEEIRGGGE